MFSTSSKVILSSLHFQFCKFSPNKMRDFSFFSKISTTLSLLSFSYSGIGHSWKCVEALTPTVDQGVVPLWRKILQLGFCNFFYLNCPPGGKSFLRVSLEEVIGNFFLSHNPGQSPKLPKSGLKIIFFVIFWFIFHYGGIPKSLYIYFV